MKLVLFLPKPDPGSFLQDRLEWWLNVVVVHTLSDLDLQLAKPDVVGWAHVVGHGSEPRENVVRRARAHPDKISIITARIPELLEQFAHDLAEPESQLFVVLRNLENPGAQIRRALAAKPPFCYTHRILEHLFPPRKRDREDWRHLLMLLFDVQDRSRSLKQLSRRSRRVHRRWWARAKKAGLKNLTAARDGILVIRATWLRRKYNLDDSELAALCGGVSERTVSRCFERIFGVPGASAADSFTLRDVIARSYRYMLVDPDLHRDLEIWRSGDLEIWRSGDLEIWRSGDLESKLTGTLLHLVRPWVCGLPSRLNFRHRRAAVAGPQTIPSQLLPC